MAIWEKIKTRNKCYHNEVMRYKMGRHAAKTWESTIEEYFDIIQVKGEKMMIREIKKKKKSGLVIRNIMEHCVSKEDMVLTGAKFERSWSQFQVIGLRLSWTLGAISVWLPFTKSYLSVQPPVHSQNMLFLNRKPNGCWWLLS